MTLNPTASCISCGRILAHESLDDAPSKRGEIDIRSNTNDGVYIRFTTEGNYGSRAFDMAGYGVEGYICDECFIKKRDRLYIYKDGENKGVRLSEHEHNERYAKLEAYGPSYKFEQEDKGTVHWISGAQLYRCITSDERSRVEKLLMSQGDDVSIPKPLLAKLNAAIREAEENLILQHAATINAEQEVSALNGERASPFDPREVEALLDKKASKMTVSGIRYLVESSEWHYKLMDWLHSNDIFTSDGQRLDIHKIYRHLILSREEREKSEKAQELMNSFIASKNKRDE